MNDSTGECKSCDKLADEIERLRGLLREWRKVADIVKDLTFAPIAVATDKALGDE
jgi:hypothetical protein